MKTLKSILKVKEKTDEMILLEVKDNSQIDLISNGFDSNVKFFRLYNIKGQKGFTMFKGPDLKPTATLEWGIGGFTLATDHWKLERDKIVEVAKEFGFVI